MKKMIFVSFMLFAITASAQDQSINWINKNAHPLNKDLSFLTKELTGKNVVALGEASHGTHEFYVQKAGIITYLITQCNFKLLSFEGPAYLMEPINLYLQSGKGDLKEHMQHLALYNTEEIYQLFMQIRQYNSDKASKDKVELIGFDSPDFWGDPFTRDQHMSEKLIKAVNNRKTIVWAHNVHILQDTTAEYMPMGAYLKKHFRDELYTIAFDTYKGTVNVLNDGVFEEHAFEAKEDSFTSMLAKARYEAFFLPFTQEDCPFKGIEGMITNIYSNWQEPKPLPVKPGVYFDALIFIKNTTASVKLSRE